MRAVGGAGPFAGAGGGSDRLGAGPGGARRQLLHRRVLLCGTEETASAQLRNLVQHAAETATKMQIVPAHTDVSSEMVFREYLGAQEQGQ